MPPTRLARVKIADDGAGHHHARGAAERLQKARADQLRQRLREDAGDRRNDSQPKAREQHGTPAEAIRQWPCHELRDCEPHHEQRDVELHGGDVAHECRRKKRERRHQDVERDRREAVHHHQQNKDLPRRAGCDPCGGDLDLLDGHVVRTLLFVLFLAASLHHFGQSPCGINGSVAASSQTFVASSSSGLISSRTRA